LFMKRYVYEIPAIFSKENVGPGGYGFTVYFDFDFGIKARREIMKPQTYNHFKENGIKIVRTFFGKKYNDMPYKFAEGSWLVHAICISYGDACDLALGQYCLEDFLGSGWKRMKERGASKYWVDYTPHNVDNIKQAMCLRELFINWANITNSCVNSD